MNIFQVLANLSNKRYKFYTEGSVEERKGLAPFVLMRWLTGTSDAVQILSLNLVANRFMFALHSHPNLLMQLLAASTTGRTKKYNWIKADIRTAKSSSKPVTQQLYNRTYGYSNREFKLNEHLLKLEDVMMLAEEVGCQQDELDAITKEWGGKVATKRKSTKRTVAATQPPVSTQPFEFFD